MNGRSHALLGAAAGLTLVILQAVETTTAIQPIGWDGMAVVVSMAAALLPDLDSTDTAARTKLGLGKQQLKREWRRRPRLSLFFRWLLTIPLNLFSWLMPHRGPTHWFSTAAALFWVIYGLTALLQLPVIIPWAFMAGYTSHLLADGLTVAGVPLFGPITHRPIHLLPRPFRFRTGGAMERLVVPTIVGTMFLFVILVILRGEMREYAISLIPELAKMP